MQHAHCYAFVDAFLIVKQMDVKCLNSIEKIKQKEKALMKPQYDCQHLILHNVCAICTVNPATKK